MLLLPGCCNSTAKDSRRNRAVVTPIDLLIARLISLSPKTIPALFFKVEVEIADFHSYMQDLPLSQEQNNSHTLHFTSSASEPLD